MQSIADISKLGERACRKRGEKPGWMDGIKY